MFLEAGDIASDGDYRQLLRASRLLKGVGLVACINKDTDVADTHWVGNVNNVSTHCVRVVAQLTRMQI